MPSLACKPRDMNPVAIPYDTQPSASIITQTTDAIYAMAMTGDPQKFEPGTYWIDRSYSPSGGSADASMRARHVEFMNTTLKAAPGAPVTQFNEHISEDGADHLAGLSNAGTNLPTPVNVYCLWDLTNTRNSYYFGRVSLDGSGKTGLCGMGASNHLKMTTWAGGGSSVYSCLIEMSNLDFGMFGCPRYGVTRIYYHDTFVGAVFDRVKINDSVNTPMIVASNTFDDAWISTLGIIATGPSYVFGTEVCIGNIFTMGVPGMYVFDLRKCLMTFSKLYCEDKPGGLGPEAAIIVRAAAWVEGALKYGASSSLTRRCMIYHEGADGGGRVVPSQHNGFGDMDCSVRLKALSTSKRRWHVEQLYPESDVFPFIVEANGSQISNGDQLTSGSADSGLAKWEHFRVGDGAGAVAGTGGLKKLLPAWA